MRLEPRAKTNQVVRVSAKLVTRSTFLHYSSDEFEHAVNQAQIDHPTLEVTERRVCLLCGAPLYGAACTACGNFPQKTSSPNEISISYEIASEGSRGLYEPFYDYDNSGFNEIDRDDDVNPLESIATNDTLKEILLQQLDALVGPSDEPIAEQLVGNLNEHGYLEYSIEEIATDLHVPVARVAYVLEQLQTLEPMGIGARNVRECLLIQLQALSEQEEPLPLAYTIIDSYAEQWLHGHIGEIARALKTPDQEVRAACAYIRKKLHPFPALMYLEDMRYARPRNEVSYMRPDVVIRKNEEQMEVELIEEKRYVFSTNSGPLVMRVDGSSESFDMQRYVQASNDAAKFFVSCVHRRWHTLKRVAELVVDYQREFLEKGVRSMRALTRAEVAARLGIDEGTVSRATANKYALLPDGRLMPFSNFFDSSLSAKETLRELIAGEDARKRWSDEELAHLMSTRGIPMARRTVTKYREEMGIGSSRER